MADQSWDVLIVGGGPAGFAAGLYACRAGLRTVLLEKATFGGQIANAERVENYPGLAEGISGYDLSLQLRQHALKYGLRAVTAEVTAVALREDPKVVTTSSGAARARTVIFAGGGDPQPLGVPGEAKYTGKGVSTCATCDGPLFQDQPVAVVGGGDTALDEAITLTAYASSVTVIHRRRELRAAHALQEKARAEPKVQFLLETTVQAVRGDGLLQAAVVQDLATGEERELPVAGLFVCIGHAPNTGYLAGALPLDKGGHIPVNLWLETAAPGVFAAGEIRQHSAKQVATAVGDGVTAAIAATRYLRSEGHP